MGGAFVIIERIVNQERSANKFIFEHGELTLSFEGARISKTHSHCPRLTTSPGCVCRITSDARIADTQKITGVERWKIPCPKKLHRRKIPKAGKFLAASVLLWNLASGEFYKPAVK
jgi:hypothetical protein